MGLGQYKGLGECGPHTNSSVLFYIINSTLCKGAYLDGCLDTPCGQRDECGTGVTDWFDCLTPDCCWAPTDEPAAPWCFKKKGVVKKHFVFKKRKTTSI